MKLIGLWGELQKIAGVEDANYNLGDPLKIIL